MNNKFLDLKLWSGANSHQQQQQQNQHVEQSIQEKVASCLQESTRNIQKMQQQQHQQMVLNNNTQMQHRVQNEQQFNIQEQQQQLLAQSTNQTNLKEKLHSEIDKIKHWKLSLDQEIVEYKQKLGEKEELLEKNRTEAKGLQLKIETITLKLQEEYDQRSEIKKRIDNTRDICQAMKEQVSRTENISTKYEQVNREVKEINSDRKKDIGDLEKNYRCLSEKTSDAFKAFKDTSERFKEETEALKSKLDQEHSNNQRTVSELNETITSKEEENETLSAEILTLKSDIGKLCKEKTTFEEKIAQLQENLSKVEQNLTQSQSNLTVEKEKTRKQFNTLRDLYSELGKCRTNLNELSSLTKNNFTGYENLLRYLSEIYGETVKKVKNRMGNIKQESNKFEAYHKTSVANLTSQNGQLIACKQELINNKTRLMGELSRKDAHLQQYNEVSKSATQDLKSFEGDIKTINETTKKLQDEFKADYDKIEDKTKNLKENLTSFKEFQKRILEETKNFIRNMASKFTETKKSLEENENNNQTLAQELQDTKEKCENLSKENEDILKNIDDLVATNSTDELSQRQTKTGELKPVDSKKTLENLTQMMNEKMKTIKSLNDTIKSLENSTSGHASMLTSKEAEFNKAKKKLEKSVEKSEKLVKEKEKKISELKAQVEELKMKEKLNEAKALQNTQQSSLVTPRINHMAYNNNSNLASPELGSISRRVSPKIISRPPTTANHAPQTPNLARKRKSGGFGETMRNKRSLMNPSEAGNGAMVNRTPKSAIPFENLDGIEKLGSGGKSADKRASEISSQKRKNNWFDSDSVFGFGE